MIERKSIVYPVRLDSEDYDRLKAFAAERDLSAAQVIRRAIRRTVKETRINTVDYSASVKNG